MSYKYDIRVDMAIPCTSEVRGLLYLMRWIVDIPNGVILLTISIRKRKKTHGERSQGKYFSTCSNLMGNLPKSNRIVGRVNDRYVRGGEKSGGWPSLITVQLSMTS